MFSGMELSFEEILCVLVVKVLLLGVMNPLHSIKRRAKVINSKGYTILLVVGCFASSGRISVQGKATYAGWFAANFACVCYRKTKEDAKN